MLRWRLGRQTDPCVRGLRAIHSPTPHLPGGKHRAPVVMPALASGEVKLNKAGSAPGLTELRVVAEAGRGHMVSRQPDLPE